ncbi:hypothetical protein M9H77_13287 [Catharanthus roseus]|uniref:Uncharacterized protein n=1 Tax=Catharanthus roseus TaxID=4058 RepID=A0ACC0BK10_CATRO|nr:hypothetical protein M9H77_13287 [Catharanthus roseus]
MGAVFCCMKQKQQQQQPRTEKDQRQPHDDDHLLKMMTLEDCLLASPSLNSPPRNHQIFKQLPRKICPSFPPEEEESQDFSTPRLSFSSSKRHDIDVNLSSKSIRKSGSGKSGKKVRFRMPDEADIYLYYTPKTTFEE